MTLEESLVAALTANTAIHALIGGRIFELTVPQDADLPAMAYQVISSSGDLAHDGPSELSQARVQLACVGSRYRFAVQLAEVVKGFFQGYRGQLGGGVHVGFCEYLNAFDGSVDEAPAAYVRYVDVRFLYR